MVSRTPPWISRQRSGCPARAGNVGRTRPLMVVKRPDPSHDPAEAVAVGIAVELDDAGIGGIADPGNDVASLSV